MKRLLIPLLFAGLAVACSGDVPTSTDGLTPNFGAAGPPVQSATGSGHFKGIFIPPDIFPGRVLGRTFAFNAKAWSDGSVTGQWQRMNHLPWGLVDDSPGQSHGVVTCMTIIDNIAYLGGYATSGLFSDPPDNEVGWFVVDNGQGAKAAPDIMSLQWVGAAAGFADEYCETQEPVPSSEPIEAGNVQVNP